MAEKVWGVKVTEETEKRADALIEASGINKKTWFEKILAIAEANNLKEAAVEYKQDITELEIHTTRIYELVSNMIQRANYLKDDAVKGLESKLESRELTITELQNSVKGLKENLSQLEASSKQADEEKQTLLEQVEGLRAGNENNQALIQEYKDKIDTLSSLVNQYKGYAVEIEELKANNSTEKEQIKAEFGEKEGRMISSIEELKATVRDQQSTIEQLQVKLDRTLEDHKAETENNKVNLNNQLIQLTERKELEKERAILEIERKYQAKLEQAHEQYNEKLSQLYERLEFKDKTNDKEK
ncbi:DNA repair exonuclease SbcCD ATPase subunit [Bradyrhizobium japonicum]